MLLQYYSVLQSTTPVLLCTTKYYSSTTLYYKGLLQYYSLYYKVLLQYYSVLQSITPVLLCAAKYYSGTTLYYKVLLRYYSVLQSTTRVLQSTTPVLACTTKYYSSTTLYYSSTTLYYKVLLQYYSGLQSATKYYSSTTLYDNLLLQYYSVLQSTATYYRITYETSFTFRGATRVSLQLHQILRLPRKMVLMIDVPHIWNVIYNARSNKHHPPTSPNTATATLHDSHDWSSWHMKHHLQCAEQQASPSNLTKYCDCHVTWLSWLILVTYETSFTMRGATGITLQPHQILCLPRKMMRIIGCRDSWNVIYNARSNRHHPPTSPNTAPATKNDAHHWSSSHMKRHLQCAEQQASPSNLTKYCTCHAKWLSWLMSVTYETSFTMRGATSITLQPHQILRLPRKIAFQNLREIVQKQLKCHLQCAADSSMIRTWSEHDPTMIRPWSDHELVISHPPVRGGYISCFEDAFCIENYNISRSGYLPRFHRILRLPRKVTLQDHQILHLPRKMILMIDIRDIWNVIYNARSNKHHPATSPNTAPATQNGSHDWSSSHMERHLQCAEQQASPSNLTKYCACHAKVHSKI